MLLVPSCFLGGFLSTQEQMLQVSHDAYTNKKNQPMPQLQGASLRIYVHVNVGKPQGWWELISAPFLLAQVFSETRSLPLI